MVLLNICLLCFKDSVSVDHILTHSCLAKDADLYRCFVLILAFGWPKEKDFPHWRVALLAVIWSVRGETDDPCFRNRSSSALVVICEVHQFIRGNVKKESCFFPVPQAAECILRVVERANVPVIYLSTDAAESETDLLQALTMRNSKTIPLVKRPGHSSSKWDALLYRNHISGDDQVEAMLDKTICAMSNVFIGSLGSTFTEDIFRLRKDWGSASVCDEYMCQGEQPNFIADTE